MTDASMIRRIVASMIAPLQRKIALSASRGTVTSYRRSNGFQQARATLLDDEVTDWVDVVMPTGVHYQVIPGTPCIHVSVGGSRSHGIIFPTPVSANMSLSDSQMRLTSGSAFGVTMSSDGNVMLSGEPTEYIARADKVQVQLQAIITKLNDLVTAYNVHTHAVAATVNGANATGTAAATTSSAQSAETPDKTAIACEKVRGT